MSDLDFPLGSGGAFRMDGWVRLLENVSSLLECALDLEQTLRVVARLPVPTLADFCELYLAQGDGALKLVEHAHGDPEQERRASHARAWFRDFVPVPVVRAAISGEPLLVPSVDDGFLLSLARDPQHLALVRKTRPRSLMIVPIRSAGGIVAALVLGFSVSSRQHDTSDLFAALELARRAGAALDTAVKHRALQDEARARNQLLRVLSRALKEPVRSLVQLSRDAELAASSGDLTRTYDAMASLRHLGGRLSQLVDDLLAGPGTASLEVLDPEPTDVEALIRGAWDRTRAPGGMIDVQVARELPAVEVDPRRMSELLRDLFDEALTVSGIRPALRVSAEACDAGIRIRVDAGRRAEPGAIDHAWWSIARQMVQAHRGTLERAESEASTTFELVLPVRGPR